MPPWNVQDVAFPRVDRVDRDIDDGTRRAEETARDDHAG
jgi:hypothetical protein